MLHFLAANWGTILVGAAIAVAAAGVIRKLYKDKKQGKTGCGCSCSGCPSAGGCSRKHR